MYQSIVYLTISLHVVLAWLSPERCNQEVRAKRADATYLNSESVPTTGGNIAEISHKQNINLIETYKNFKFVGVPIRGTYSGDYLANYEVYMPNQCTFYTYNPRLLCSIYCQDGVTCKLGRSVSTSDSYTASEGYNWGVKVSAKSKFLEIIEIGGEVSTGGAYSCAYTKSRTKTDNVECSTDSGGGKILQLYNVKSDMKCQFSTVTMVSEIRNGKSEGVAPIDYFTDDEWNMVKTGAILTSRYGALLVLPNLDSMSDDLLEKMQNIFPDYNPYTDLVKLTNSSISSIPSMVFYFKVGSSTPGKKKVIPFTNEAGDFIYQYACVLT